MIFGGLVLGCIEAGFSNRYAFSAFNFFKLYEICTLSNRSKLNILAKNWFKKSAFLKWLRCTVVPNHAKQITTTYSLPQKIQCFLLWLHRYGRNKIDMHFFQKIWNVLYTKKAHERRVTPRSEPFAIKKVTKVGPSYFFRNPIRV